jgi:hypothetical protein
VWPNPLGTFLCEQATAKVLIEFEEQQTGEEHR